MFNNTYLGDSDFNKNVARLTIPGAVQSLLYIGVNAINNLLTGKYFGDIEMSAVSQAATVFSIYEVLTYGFAASCSILVAQYWGKKDQDKINKVISLSMRLEILMGALFTMVMSLAPDKVMSIMSNDPQVAALGAEYLRITAPTYLLFGINNNLYSAFRSVELVQVCLWGNASCYILNMVLSYTLVPTMGVTGAGYAALVSRTIESIFLIIYLFKNKRLNYTVPGVKYEDPDLIINYLKVTWPVLGHELIWSIGNNMNQILMGKLDVVATSAYSIAITLSNLVCFMNSGVGHAAMTTIGKRIGSGDYEGAQKSANTFIWYSLFTGTFAVTAMLLLRNKFISLYSNASAATVELASSMMLALTLLTFCHGIDSIVLVNTLRSGGSGSVGLFTDIVVMWFIGIPLGWLALLKWQLSPIWIVFLVKLDMPLKSIVGIYTVLKTKWIKNLTVSAKD